MPSLWAPTPQCWIRRRCATPSPPRRGRSRGCMPTDAGSSVGACRLPMMRLVGPAAFVDQAQGVLTVQPTNDLGLLALEVLVCVKERLDLPQSMRRDVAERVERAEAGITMLDGDDLMIVLAHVTHVQHAEHARVHQAPGKDRLFGQDQHVEGIAVRRTRVRNEPVMGRIVDRGVQDAIEPDAAALLVVLIFVAAAHRNLDERFDDVVGLHCALLYRFPDTMIACLRAACARLCHAAGRSRCPWSTTCVSCARPY